jgi:hypothetical protein
MEARYALFEARLHTRKSKLPQLETAPQLIHRREPRGFRGRPFAGGISRIETVPRRGDSARSRSVNVVIASVVSPCRSLSRASFSGIGVSSPSRRNEDASCTTSGARLSGTSSATARPAPQRRRWWGTRPSQSTGGTRSWTPARCATRPRRSIAPRAHSRAHQAQIPRTAPRVSLRK